jgi:hypothetical protein
MCLSKLEHVTFEEGSKGVVILYGNLLIKPSIRCVTVPVGVAVKKGRRPLFFDILYNEISKLLLSAQLKPPTGLGSSG